MMEGKSIDVSLCMIARNEEVRIGKTIESVRSLVDEIILVDTGSQDHTIQIAEQKGAVIYKSEWRDDFSAARNLGLTKARGKWILVLDADEVMEPVKREQFLHLLDDKQVGGYFIRILSLTGKPGGSIADQAVRLFRNRPEYRFHGAIHEQIAGSIVAAGGGIALADSGLTLLHYGYLPEEIIRKEKSKRNQAIIRREMAAKPEDPFPLYCFGIELLQENLYQEGYRYLEQAFVRMNGDEGYFPHVFLTLVLGYSLAGDYSKMAQALARCPQKQKAIPEVKLAQGILYYKTGKCRDAIRCWEELSDQQQKAMEISPEAIYALLGDAYCEIQEYQTAELKYCLALQRRPGAISVFKRLLELRRREAKLKSWEAVSRFLPPKPVPGLLHLFVSAEEGETGLIFVLLYVLRYFCLPMQYWGDEVKTIFLRLSQGCPSKEKPEEESAAVQDICRKEFELLLYLREHAGMTDWNLIYQNSMVPLLETWLSLLNQSILEDGGHE